MGFKRRKQPRPRSQWPNLWLPPRGDDGCHGSTFDCLVSNKIEIAFFHKAKDVYEKMDEKGWVLMAHDHPPCDVRVITLSYPKTWRVIGLHHAMDINWQDGETGTWARYYPARVVVAWHLVPQVPGVFANELMDRGNAYDSAIKRAASEICRYDYVHLKELHHEEK